MSLPASSPIPHSRRRLQRVVGAGAAAAVVLGSVLFVQRAAGDAANPMTVTLAGDLQQELGCPGDWQPDCVTTHLTQQTDSNLWSGDFTVPAGDYEYKFAIDDDWPVSYGLNGGSDNIPLHLAGSTELRFTFDNTTHRASVAPTTLTGGYTAADDALVAAPVRQPGSSNQYYFVMTDRFANGDPTDDQGGLTGDRLTTGYDPTAKGFYEGGDLTGLTEKLDYIKGLGTSAIWLTPSFKNQPVQGPPGQESAGYHGYWITDFTQIDPHLGTNDQLTALIAAAHAKGMKVFFDIIANHTADVIGYQQGQYTYIDQATTPYRAADGTTIPDLGAVANQPGFPTFDAATSFPYTPVIPVGKEHVKVPDWLNDPVYYHNRGDSTFSGESSTYGDFSGLDDLMTENPFVEQGFEDIYNSWVDFGVDGFRIDTVKHVNTQFWQDWTPAVAAHAVAQGRNDFFMFGEVYSSDASYTSSFMRNGAQEGVLDFPFQSAAVGYAKGESAKSLSRLFASDPMYTTPTTNALSLPTFLGNHDMGRIGYFLQDCGNGTACSAPVSRDQFAHELMFYARGNPVVYYGDEQGFAGIGGDQSARQSMFASQVDEYTGQPLVDGTTFGTGDHFDTGSYLYGQIGHLSAVRSAHPGLSNGAQIELYAQNGVGIYAFSRVDPTERVEYVVAANNAQANSTATFSTLTPGASYSVIDGVTLTPTPIVADADGSITVDVPALSVLVLQADRQVAAPAVDEPFGVTAPTPGAAATGLIPVSAAGEDNRWSQTSFAYRPLGGTWTPLGTAESDAPTVYADMTAVPRGTIVEYRAVSVDAAGVKHAASTYASVGFPIDGSNANPGPVQPDTVGVPGDFNNEVGCGSDWDPACDAIQLTKRPDGFWGGTFTIPATAPDKHYEYKVAIDRSWAENYGAGGVAAGSNISFTVPETTDVSFYYDPVSHIVQNTAQGPIVTLPGNFQNELGCPGDWQPDCLISWMHPSPGDPNLLTFSADIPAGNYEVKVAYGLDWPGNYGAGGKPDGPNIAFTAVEDGPTVFTFDLTTHLLTVGDTPPATSTSTTSSTSDPTSTSGTSSSSETSTTSQTSSTSQTTTAPTTSSPSETSTSGSTPVTTSSQPNTTSSGSSTPSTSSSQSSSTPGLTVTVSPSTVAAGATVAISGSGFTPNESIQVWLNSDPQLLVTVTASQTGAVSTTVRIPADTPVGEHTIRLIGASGTASATVTVTSGSGAPAGGGAPGNQGRPGPASSSSSLSYTGFPTIWFGAGAAALIVLGGLLLVVSRRRRGVAQHR